MAAPKKKIAKNFFAILGLDKTMSVLLKAKKPINVPGMEMIPIKTMNGEPYFVETKKCFSYGVKRDSKFKTLSMSLRLDEETIKTLRGIVKECEDHLNSPLTKKLFYGDDENTIYPKLKPSVKFYEVDGEEVDVSEYEDKTCDVKAVLEVTGILFNGDKIGLQVKVYEALVKENVRKHVRLVGMAF